MKIELSPISQTDEDGSLIMNWRNDPVTITMSYNQKIYNWDEFRPLYYNNYFNNYIPSLFAIFDQVKIGFVGFSETLNPEYIVISINLDPIHRYKGYGTPIIKKVLYHIRQHFPVIKYVISEIKTNNHSSIRVFEKSGFRFIRNDVKHNYDILIYQFNLDDLIILPNRLKNSNDQVYIIAELSCNHNQNLENAYKLIDSAYQSGANAVKLQTYTPETITMDSNNPIFRDCLKNSIWEGNTLYQLYSTAYTPWNWHLELKKYANSLGLDFFSTPFDTTAVDFLESLNVPIYKVASFELTDHVLLNKIAKTGKPVILSSGMGTISEIQEAVEILQNGGVGSICVLKCTSAYPAKLEDANLRTMIDIHHQLNVSVGISDHTTDQIVPIVATAMGASVIEKHLTLSKNSGSPDDAFSLTPDQFKQMVDSVRLVEKTLGSIKYGGSDSEQQSKQFRRSLFVVNDVKKGEIFTEINIKSIRPSNGLETKYYSDIIGKSAKFDIKKGTPLSWELID